MTTPGDLPPPKGPPPGGYPPPPAAPPPGGYGAPPPPPPGGYPPPPPPGGYPPPPPPGGSSGGYGAPPGGYGAPPPPPGYGPPGGYPGQPTRTNPKAIISLVLGVVGLCFCGIVLGVGAAFLGNQAKNEIAASGGQQTGAGLAQAGFIVGIVAAALGVVQLVLVASGRLNYFGG